MRLILLSMAINFVQVEAQLNLVQRETQEYTSTCVAEAQKMADTMEADTHKLEIVEREVADFLKVWPCLFL